MRMLRGYYFWFPAGTSNWEFITFSLIRLFIALIIVTLIISFVKVVRGRSNIHYIQDTSLNFSSALQVLNDRLAKGEITIEEHNRLKKEISG